jgi:hypothetical protein
MKRNDKLFNEVDTKIDIALWHGVRRDLCRLMEWFHDPPRAAILPLRYTGAELTMTMMDTCRRPTDPEVLDV